MVAYRIRYAGPMALAVHVATMVADADGVNLMSSAPPEHRHDPADSVVLELTVEAAPDDLLDAVGVIRGGLPGDATIEIESVP